MSEFNISIPGGESKRLKTGGTYCPADIVVTAEKSGPVVEKDVNFYDYDGELLYSYSLEEAQALTDLPPAPTPKRDFLDFDEWNWTLEQIKSFNLPVDVGATYKTKDEKTYLVIEVTDPARMEITLNYAQWGSSIKVDWGDGSAEEETTQDGGVNVTKKHTYSGLGKYTITINANAVWNAGLNSRTAPLIGTGDNDYASGYFLKEVYAGKGIRFLSNAFIRAIKLEMIVISKQAVVNEKWYSVFYNCPKLKAVIIPSVWSVIPLYYFDNCRCLQLLSIPYNITGAGIGGYTQIKRLNLGPNVKYLTIGIYSTIAKIRLPEGLEEIGESSFDSNATLNELELPKSVKYLNYAALRNCGSLMYLRFKSETPPEAYNPVTFTGIPTTCIVEVPTGTLATYQSATNYGSIAAQMVEV